MSQRLARRSAGKQVVARAHRLSDDTLKVEKTCSLAVRRVFSDRMGVAVEAFGAGWKRAKANPMGLRGDAKMRNRIFEAHDRATAQSQPLIEGLVQEILGMTVDSIREELLVCERTLAKRYGGVTDEAMLCLRAVEEDQWVRPRLVAYRESLVALRKEFRTDTRRQIQFAGTYKDDLAKASRRLFSTTPNRLQGNGGMGMWWRTTSSIDAAITTASITLQSQVRTAAMAAFNEAGASR